MKQNLTINFNLGVIAVAITSFCFYSCTKEDDKDEPTQESGIYATYTYGGESRNRKAILWKDGVETDLSNYDPAQNGVGTNIYTGDVAVSSSGDVYVVGCECLEIRSDIPNIPSYYDNCSTIIWKNGVKQILNAQPIERWFLDTNQVNLAINDNDDVFVLGKEGGANAADVSVWKNGTRIIDISDDYLEIYDMFVKDNDVYLSGVTYANATYISVLYKNSVLQTVSATDQRITTVFVSNNNDVYLGLNDGKLLKNNVDQPLEGVTGSASSATVIGISVKASDVYVLGYANGSPIIWKNGQQLYELNDNIGIYTRSTLSSIFINGNDVYAYGTLFNSSSCCGGKSAVVIYKNGELFETIYDDLGIFVDAPSIFIK